MFDTLRKTVANWRAFFSRIGVDSFVPSGVREFVSEVLRRTKLAAGAGTPGEQIRNSIISALLLAPTIPFSAGATAVLLIPLAVTFVVGCLRMAPPMDRLWGRVQPTVSEDRDVPGWTRD